MSGRALGAAALFATGAALALGCTASDEAPPEAPAPAGAIQASLAVEVLDTGSIALAPRGEAVDVTLDLGGHGYACFDAASPLVGTGRFRTLAEARTESYTAVFHQPAMSKGKCGDQPVTLALSMVRRTDPGAKLAGALTVYCGDAALGTPARMIRLAEVSPK